MRTPHDLEARLRDEAGQAGPPPSPHLHTRIMAEVSSLQSEPAGVGGSRRLGMATGAVVVLILAIVAANRMSAPFQEPRPAEVGVGSWPEVTAQATTVSNELHAVLADPFGREVNALASDAGRATRFLAACIPL